jgi:hypothetical protein
VNDTLANNWRDLPVLQRRIPWATATSGKPHIVFEAAVGQEQWEIRMNDFPDEPLYTLLIDDRPLSFLTTGPRSGLHDHSFLSSRSIEEMKASYDDTTAGSGSDTPIASGGKFKVPRSSWESVISALSRTTKDNNPAEWMKLGASYITKEDGSRLEVDFLHVRGESGAFAIEQGSEDRQYSEKGDGHLEESLQKNLPFL